MEEADVLGGKTMKRASSFMESLSADVSRVIRESDSFLLASAW